MALPSSLVLGAGDHRAPRAGVGSDAPRAGAHRPCELLYETHSDIGTAEESCHAATATQNCLTAEEWAKNKRLDGMEPSQDRLKLDGGTRRLRSSPRACRTITPVSPLSVSVHLQGSVGHRLRSRRRIATGMTASVARQPRTSHLEPERAHRTSAVRRSRPGTTTRRLPRRCRQRRPRQSSGGSRNHNAALLPDPGCLQRLQLLCKRQPPPKMRTRP